MSTPQTRGRMTLLLIAAAFTLPIVAAAFLYFGDNGWRPGGSTHFGTLITPAKTLPDTVLALTDPPTVLRKIWTMAILSGDECDDACATALRKTRQVRLALGPKMTRLQLIFMPAQGGALSAELAAEHPRLIVIDPTTSKEIIKLIGDYNSGDVFLIDPLGNLMMLYTDDAEMSGMRSDIAHLLKFSTIG